MISKPEMIEFFGEENLVCANSERLQNINLSNETREFILNTGFPTIIGHFRFSMEFQPISEDIQIGESVKHLEQLYTIGYESASQVIGRSIYLDEIDLPNSASLSEIGEKVRILGVEEYFLFNADVVLAPRICIDLGKGEIVYVTTDDFSIFFFNSSIQQLSAALIAYTKVLLARDNFEETIKSFTEELEIIDPKALANEENVWMIIIEQLIEDEKGY